MLMTKQHIEVTIIDHHPTAWRCEKCGHIVGHVERKGNNRILDMVAERGIKITSGSIDIHCLHCGHVLEWHAWDYQLTRVMDKVMGSKKK
jgi:hypothetical protein